MIKNENLKGKEKENVIQSKSENDMEVTFNKENESLEDYYDSDVSNDKNENLEGKRKRT